MMVAHIQVDQEPGEPGYVELAIIPPLRGHGLGVAMLNAFIDRPGHVFPELEGRIAADNAASLACARRCGFQQMPEPDEQSLIRVVRRLSQR
jgi:RimJ/RimL family protein N-acetyltransferase